MEKNHVSVIIPTFNEAAEIAATVRAVRAQQPAEIVVVDGGSTDATAAEAKEADVVMQAPRGRASQMNAGAARACGEFLLFLHADCQLENGALAAAVRCLRRPTVMAGCFSMRVRAAGRWFRWIDACASARVRLTGFIYGDQGFCVRRSDFQHLGGFPDVPFLEDVLFSRTLRSRGKMAVLPQRIWVSPRRWLRVGLIRQTLRNWGLTTLAAAGVSPHWLAQFYPAVR